MRRALKIPQKKYGGGEMPKQQVMRFVENLYGKSATADEILCVFPRHRWKAIRREIQDLVRSKELKPVKLGGKVHYVSEVMKKLVK